MALGNLGVAIIKLIGPRIGLMPKVGGAKGVALKLGERAASHLAPRHSPGDKR